MLAAAAQTFTYLAALFLTVLMVVSGLRGISVCRTHREDIDMEEDNILWTCLSNPPGKLIPILMSTFLSCR
jgi:hypothetical protein